MGEHKSCKSCAGGEGDNLASPSSDRRIIVPGCHGDDGGAQGSFVQASPTSRLITRASVATLQPSGGALAEHGWYYRKGEFSPTIPNGRPLAVAPPAIKRAAPPILAKTITGQRS